MLSPLSPTYACSLSHFSHQVKCLEWYKGVFGLWWGTNFLQGQSEGSRTPALPSQRCCVPSSREPGQLAVETWGK